MKNLFLLTILFLPLFVTAQTETKPPKLRIEPSFLNTKYELGDKTTPKKEVALHLKQYETDAYIKWKSADKAEVNSLVWSVLGLTALIVGLTAEEPESQLVWIGGAAGAEIISLVCTFNGKSRRQKAIDIYNTKYGY